MLPVVAHLYRRYLISYRVTHDNDLFTLHCRRWRRSHEPLKMWDLPLNEITVFSHETRELHVPIEDFDRISSSDEPLGKNNQGRFPQVVSA